MLGFEDALAQGFEHRQADVPGDVRIREQLQLRQQQRLALDRGGEALPLLREAVEIRRRVLPPDDPLRELAETSLREAERLAGAAPD